MNATSTAQIRIVDAKNTICTDKLRRVYEPSMKIEFKGVSAKAVEAATKLCNLANACSAPQMLERAEALKAKGYTVTIAKSAMENEAIAKVFNAPRPGAALGWVTRSTSHSSTYFITCASEAECMAEFKKLCGSYHPAGYGTCLADKKPVAAGFMIKVTRSNSCD